MYDILHANQLAYSFEKESRRPFVKHENRGTQSRQKIPYVEDSPVIPGRPPNMAKAEANISVDGGRIKDNWGYRSVTVFSS
jgi:hypothetical protein